MTIESKSEELEVSVNSLDIVREQILNVLLLVITISAPLPLAFSLYRIPEIGWQTGMYFQIASYLMICIATIFQHRLPYIYKALILNLICFTIGCIGTINIGLVGTGIMFMIFSVILTTMFFGIRHAIVSVIASLAFLAMVALGVTQGWINFPFDIESVALSLSSWTLIIVAFALFSTILIFSLGRLINYLADSSDNLKERSLELRRINKELLYEISKKKKAELALQKSEEKYRTVLEANPDSVVVYDIEGKVIYFNPAFTHVFGWSLEECIGKKMDVFVPQDAWPETKMMIEKVRAGKRFSGIETYRYTLHGESLPVSVSGAIYKDQNGKPIGSIINLRDISDQKNMEAQLQQSQKFEAIGTLAGGIAHDFNNLLMGIQGRTSLLAVDLKSQPGMEHTRAIEDYIKSATNLTKQLLGLARGGKYEVKPTDLNELLRNSAKMFGRTKKEIRIHTKLRDTPLAVEVDYGQIEQVLLNLYVNAWQAMPDGGELFLTTRIVTLDDYYIEAYNVKPGRYAKASITDTGIGMHENIQQQIFDPFFTTKEKGRGTGLGLASAYGIIKNHDGIITVNSKLGHGTTFEIYLPLSNKMPHQEIQATETLLNGTERLLLVDDETMILEVGQAMLEKLGYQVSIADSGQKALDMIYKKGDEIDLVILDLIMPGLDGSKVFDQVKETQPQMPILLSSGYAINGQADAIMKRGCNGFIQKPFNISELSQKVRKVLDAVKNSA